MDVLLGVDVGTTNIKCIAIEPDGRCIKVASVPTIEYGLMEDANRMFAGVCKVIHVVLRALPSDSVIRGIAASSVGCGAYCLNHKDEQIYPKKSKKDFLIKDCIAVTGYPPGYQNAGYQLLAAADDCQEVAKVLSVADYIAYRLSGKFGRDVSTAGSMSMYDRRKNIWWDDFKKATGLTDQVLGKVYYSGTRIGRITVEAMRLTGIPKGVSVVLGGHDYLCAAFALGCVEEGNVLNMLGTYEIVSSFSAKPMTYPPEVQAFSDCHCYPHRYSLTCETMAGGQMEWLRSTLPGGEKRDFWNDIYWKIDALSPSHEAKNRKEIYIPRTFGEYFPTQNIDGRGGFIGLSPESTPASLMAAAIEGLCMYSREMVEFVASGKPHDITVTGGGSRSDFWLQTKADVLSCFLSVPEVVEASATGAALLAGVGSGIYANHEEAADVYRNVPQKIVEPNPKRVQIFEQVYHEIYKPMLEMTLKYDKTKIVKR